MTFIQYFFILYFKTVLSQFTPHIDLQKLGEIVLKGEKYKILKPTVHEVSNDFENQKLRRNTRDNERIFMDDYGFRHFWKGLENRKNYGEIDNGLESYRRDDDMFYNANESVKKKSKRIAKKYVPPKTFAKPSARAPAIPSGKAPDKPSVRSPTKPTAKPAAKPTAKPAAKPTAKPAAKPTAKPAAKTTAKPAKGSDSGGGRTVGKTFFFCPFLGVIAMKGFID